MDKNWLLRSYMKLPLWGKVAIPLAAVFLVVAALKALNVALWLGLIGVAVYVVLQVADRFSGKK
ncbi:MAG: hypothetical protein EAZ89_13365 [Bacteroidetes bacterium]|jgi:hypothetical protein|nr:MAG: hypothetical protein EAZ89_13365 [Bacteroidota bacterium]